MRTFNLTCPPQFSILCLQRKEVSNGFDLNFTTDGKNNFFNWVTNTAVSQRRHVKLDPCTCKTKYSQVQTQRFLSDFCNSGETSSTGSWRGRGRRGSRHGAATLPRCSPAAAAGTGLPRCSCCHHGREGKSRLLEWVERIQFGGGGCRRLCLSKPVSGVNLAGQGAERCSGHQSGFVREENWEEQMDPLFLGTIRSEKPS